MSLMPLGLLSFSAGGGGAGANALTLISTQVLGSNASSVTFSSIASSFTHLQLRITARTSYAGDIGAVQWQFNGDTSAVYTFHILGGDGTSASSIGGTSSTAGGSALIGGSTTTANVFGAAIIDILDYKNTSKNKTVRYLNGTYNSGPNKYVRLGSNLWPSTAAISSIVLSDVFGGNFVTGSRFSLYGVS